MKIEDMKIQHCEDGDFTIGNRGCIGCQIEIPDGSIDFYQIELSLSLVRGNYCSSECATRDLNLKEF